MKKRVVLYLLTLILTACAPQPAPTDTSLPPTVPVTQTLAVVQPTATLPIVAATETLAVPTATNVVAPTATLAIASPPPLTGIHNPYAVILVNPDDVLNVRNGAGVGNAIAGTLQPTVTGVNRTGPASSAGGDRWVEIQNPNGWVNANFLTEYIAPADFCTDSRVSGLLNDLEIALLNSNGELLSSLVSPVHGIDLRLWRYGTVANYTQEEASWVFLSDYVVSWGPAPGSGLDTVGTFSAEPLPKLQEVFGANYSLHCNDTLDLATFSVEPWPPEYANINFYTVYKPGTEQYGGLDWRAWTVGVEYVQGKPTLFALIHYQWEP